MEWKRLGHVFVADRHREWMQTHAAYPKAFNLNGDVYRIYFSSRDAGNRSHIGYLDLDLSKPTEIVALSMDPVLSPGASGMFDDCGVIPCCIVKVQGRVALYYMGISLAVTVPSSSFCGLAYLNDDMNQATRASPAPIIERSETDPVSGGAAFVPTAEGGMQPTEYTSQKLPSFGLPSRPRPSGTKHGLSESTAHAKSMSTGRPRRTRMLSGRMSRWVIPWRFNSAKAHSTLRALWYGRSLVMPSNASATRTMRASSGMRS